jgi:hypothetical protein
MQTIIRKLRHSVTESQDGQGFRATILGLAVLGVYALFSTMEIDSYHAAAQEVYYPHAPTLRPRPHRPRPHPGHD